MEEQYLELLVKDFGFDSYYHNVLRDKLTYGPLNHFQSYKKIHKVYIVFRLEFHASAYETWDAFLLEKSFYNTCNLNLKLALHINYFYYFYLSDFFVV